MARGLKKKIRSMAPAFGESEVVQLNPVDTEPRTVGELLRTKREEFGVDLRETAEFLRIRYAYLLAIEEGEVDGLPGATYAMGFVRAYADHLGLDGPAIVERYKEEMAELGDDVRLVFPSPLPEGKVPSGTILVVAVLALALVYGGWLAFTQTNIKIAELVPALPESFRSFLGSDETATVEVADAPAAEAPTKERPSDTTAAPAPEKAGEPEAPATKLSSEAEITTIQTPPIQTPAEPNLAATKPTPKITLSDPKAPPETSESQTDIPKVGSAESAVSETAQKIGAAVETSAATPEGDRTVALTDKQIGSTPPSTSEPAVPSGGQPMPQELSRSATVVAVVPDTASTTTDTETGARAAVAISVSGAEISEATPTNTNSSQGAVAPIEDQEGSGSTSNDTASPVVAALPPEPPASASTKPHQYGVENTESRVTILARIDSWVEIRDSNGDTLLTRVLRVGDSYRVPDKPGLRMLTGNAGGLSIKVDNAEIPDIGPKGAVRRDVLLDAEALKAAQTR